MKNSKPVYLRVNETEVMLVEIQSVDSKHKKLQDKHIQEIIELLRDTVTGRVEQIHKRNVQAKNKTATGILTGTSVRVGYSFKNKPGNQMCLYTSNIMQYGKYSSEEDLSFLKVVSEKLVVYVQLLVPGSPKGMSQILRRLSDVKQTSGSGISISSYFQKMPSSQQSSVQGTGTIDTKKESETQFQDKDQDLREVSSLPVDGDATKLNEAPPSEGRRHKIKSILERGHFPGKKKRSKPAVTTVFMDGNSCDSYKSVAMEKAKTNDIPIANHSSDILDPVHKISGTKGTLTIDRNIDVITEEYNESHSFTVRKIDASCVTEVSRYIDVPIQITKQDLKQEGESGEVINIQAMEVEAMNVKEVDTHVTEVMKQTAESEAESVDTSLDKFDSPASRSDSSDTSMLPSASFCAVKSNKRWSHFNKETLQDILNTVENKQLEEMTEQNSPVFNGKSGKNTENEETVETVCDKRTTSTGQTDKMTATEKEANVKNLKRFRYKRKFPIFFDSDSDDSVPEKKRQNVSSSQNEKFTNMTTLKEKYKKFQISKDFFTNSKPKSQPKLSFFSNKMIKNKKEISDNYNKSDSVKVNEGFPDLEIELIEELSDCPRVKSEADLDLLKEVQSLSDVQNLNEQQIRFLIRRNDIYLRSIFEGKTKCARHEAYKKGGNSRRDLNYASRLGPYSDEQLDIVMECLMSIFCKKHHKYLDYIMKVLLPELLIQFHMEIHGTTHEESEKLLAPSTPEQLASS